MKHGLTAYASGKCRCGTCKGVWAEYIRNRRRREKPGRRTRSHVARAAFFPDKQPRVGVSLTDLGMAILNGAVQRTGRNLDDVIEQMARQCGDHVAFDGRHSTAA